MAKTHARTDACHRPWGCLDAKIPPRLTIDSGDTITIDTVSGGLPMLAIPRSCCRTIARSARSSDPRPVRTS